MSLGRRIWKWSAAIGASVLVLCTLVVGSLRIWLEHSPEVANDIVARVEAVTNLRLKFERLDATLGWYGPELVFRHARILAKETGATVVTARAGRVGFDVWRAISTGRLASARVSLDGAVVHVLLLSTGVELLGEEALRRGETDSTPLKIASLPVGRVRLNDGMIVVEDRRRERSGFSIDHVRLDLDRDPRMLKIDALVKLPRTLGSRLEVRGSVEGNGEDSPFAWSSSADGRGLRFDGISDLARDVLRLPLAGTGDVHFAMSGTGLTVTHADTTLTLANLKLPALVDGQPPVPSELSGSFSLERGTGATGAWRVRAHDVVMGAGRTRWNHGQFEAEWVAGPAGIERVKVRTPDLPLAVLAPFASLFPQPAVREAAAALMPAGRLLGVDVTAAPGGAQGWGITGAGSFRGLAIGAWRKVPGLGPLDGEFAGQGDHGTLALRTHAFTLNLTQWLRAPVGADAITANVRWSHAADGWHLASDDALAVTPDARGGGVFRLWIPTGQEPPHLVLDLAIRDVDVRGAAKYLPLLRMPQDAVSWLDNAFLAGRIPQARLQYVGPVEGFPFRAHQGLFLVQAQLAGVRVHYADGWDDVEDLNGEAEFRNEGMSAQLRSARLGGLIVGPSRARIADFRDSDIEVEGSAAGDLHRALRYLQGSPLGKSLGSYFAGLDGHGPLQARVKLYLPLRHFVDRRVTVEAHLDHASLHLGGLSEDVTDLSGTLRLNNLDIDVPGLTGTLLGGPLSVKAETLLPKNEAAGVHLLQVHAQGHALADRLQAQLGMTLGTWLRGGTDWRAEVRAPRLAWMRPLPPRPPTPTLLELREAQAGTPIVRPPDDHPPPPPREAQSRWQPVAVHVDAPLAGLALDFPAPLAKDAGEPRRLALDLSLDPGLRAGEPAPPKSLAAADEPHDPRLALLAALGSDSFAGEWLPRAATEEGTSPPHDPAPARDSHEGGAGLSLRHATVHFGAGAARLKDAPGIWLEGRMPRLDLGAWLRVQTSDKPGRPLNQTLRGGELSVDRLDLLGFELKEVHGTLAAGSDAWAIRGSGPDAQGGVEVPYDLKGGRPLSIRLERLTLNERAGAAGGDGSRDPPGILPAIDAHVGNLEFLHRRLGEVTAVLSRVDGGLKLEHADAKAPSFSAHATGRWTGEGDAELCEVDVSLHSTDLKETLAALAFEPSVAAQATDAHGLLRWRDGIDGTILERLQGHAHVQVKQGQILSVQPGAGRVFGLLSVATLPRRLALDFRDLTDKGFAFDTIQGDFEFRDGNAYTNNTVVKGPAADIGLVGRTGFKAQDYDQIAVVTGHFSDGLAAAGALAGGPVVGGALFLFGKVFQGAVEGIARGYYRITGTWDKPKVESVGSSAAREVEAGTGALAPPSGDPPPADPAPVKPLPDGQ